jgi:plastocyanin
MRHTIRWLVVVMACAAFTACSSDDGGALIEAEAEATAADYQYLIPAGTADRIADGELVEILPAELAVNVGEVIRIVNEDDEGHFVGIFFVGAGETVTQRFASPGEFVGQCTVHPSGQLSLKVYE